MAKQKYKFETSLGDVVIAFDKKDFKVNRGGRELPVWAYLIDSKRRGLIGILSGSEIIDQLYDGIIIRIKLMQDNSMWVEVDLYDKEAGSPEYKLERIS